MTAMMCAQTTNALQGALIDPGGTIVLSEISTSPATCGIRVASDRGLDEKQSIGYTYISDWLRSYGVVADYEVRAVQNSGTAVSGSALNSFLACSTSREWFISSTGADVANLTITIRKVSAPALSIEFDVTLDATVI